MVQDVGSGEGRVWETRGFMGTVCTQFCREPKTALKKKNLGTSLAVQWLSLHASTARGMVSVPGQGTEIPHVACHGQKSSNNKVY